jgi:hypothetical protein|nr:MAG TPA: hypothetical protein [Caudoviricetes sp.]
MRKNRKERQKRSTLKVSNSSSVEVNRESIIKNLLYLYGSLSERKHRNYIMEILEDFDVTHLPTSCDECKSQDAGREQVFERAFTDKGLYSVMKIKNTFNKHYGMNVDEKYVKSKIKEYGFNTPKYVVIVEGMKFPRYRRIIIEDLYHKILSHEE